MSTEAEKLRAALQIGLEAAEQILIERMQALAGYPHKWKREQDDADQIRAALAALSVEPAVPPDMQAISDAMSMDDEGRRRIANSHHYTVENIAALVVKLKGIERGEWAAFKDVNHRAHAGVLWRVITGLAAGIEPAVPSALSDERIKALADLHGPCDLDSVGDLIDFGGGYVTGAMLRFARAIEAEIRSPALVELPSEEAFERFAQGWFLNPDGSVDHQSRAVAQAVQRPADAQLELIEETRALVPVEYRQIITDAICNAWCGGFNECADTQRSSHTSEPDEPEMKGSP